MLQHIRQLVSQAGMEMLEGSIRVNPIKKGKETACQYCPYRGICQFDRRLEDNTYRIIPNLEKDQIIQELAKGKEEG